MTEIEMKVVCASEKVLKRFIEFLGTGYPQLSVAEWRKNTRPPKIGHWRVYVYVIDEGEGREE